MSETLLTVLLLKPQKKPFCSSWWLYQLTFLKHNFMDQITK